MRRLFLLALFLCLCSIPAYGELRNDPFNALPDTNKSTIRTDGLTFFGHEDAQREGRHFVPFIATGGLHSTSASLTSAAFATEAYVPERIDQTATSITYVALAGDTCTTIISSANTGIAGWTRVGTTAYYFKCSASAARPLLPANSAFLMAISISGAGPAITTVLDLTYGPLSMVAEASLASFYGVKCDGGTTDNSTPLVNALLAVKRWGGKLILPGSSLTCDYSTGLVIRQSWLIIEGQGSGWSDNQVGAAPTRLRYTGTGNAITIGGGSTTVSNIIFRDFDLIGSASAGHGIYLVGTSSTNFALRTLFQRLYIHGFTQTNKSGFFHEGGIENTLDRVYLYNNYINLSIGSVAGGATTTTFTCHTCLIRQAITNGVFISGTSSISNILFDAGSVFESNGQSGIYVPDTNTGVIYSLTVGDSHFEGNNLTGGSYQFETRGTGALFVRNVHIHHTRFVAPLGAGGDINFQGTIDSSVQYVAGGAAAGKHIVQLESNVVGIFIVGIDVATGGDVDPSNYALFKLAYDGVVRSQGLFDHLLRGTTGLHGNNLRIM